MKIILDTNLWISYLISNRLIHLDKLIYQYKLTSLFSSELLQEFIEVASRAKLRKYFDHEDIIDLLLTIENYGLLVDVKSNIEICKDSKDNFLLNLAKDGKADYLLTGDSDLLEIGEYEGTRIVTYQEFVEIFKEL